MIELINSFKPDVVINVALPYQDLTIMDACLATGVHYVDTANYEPPDTAKFEYKWQWAYKERFDEAGLTLYLEADLTQVLQVYSRPMPKSIISMKFIPLISSMSTPGTMDIHLRRTSIRKLISVK